MPWRTVGFWADAWHWAVEIIKELIAGAAALGALWVTGKGYYEKVTKPRRERAAMLARILEVVERQEAAISELTAESAKWAAITQSSIESDTGITTTRDASGQNFFTASAGWNRLTGLDANTASNGGWRRSIAPDDLERVEHMWESAKGPPPGVFVCEYHLRHISKALGGSTPVEETASPMYDKRKNFIGWASRIQMLSEPLMPSAAPKEEIPDD